ncbi:MAG: hypothetical protein IPP07_30490 [Holophagales bacterium]|nr:hypothetical protein [Holophagales bacterium]
MARKNFIVPLPPENSAALRKEAEARGIPATTLVRAAVKGWIDDQKAKRLRDDIAAYAMEMTGTGADLDAALEMSASAKLNAATDRDCREARSAAPSSDVSPRA